MVTLRSSPAGASLLALAIFSLTSILRLSSYEATVEVGICRRHLGRVRLASGLCTIAVATSLAMIVAGVALGIEYGTLWLAGIVGLLAVPVLASLGGRLVGATRIEEGRVWVKGACPAFLAEFPEKRHPGNSGQRREGPA